MDHVSDSYFCLTSINGVTAKSKHTVQYSNLPSAMRPEPHSAELLVSKPPTKMTLSDSESSDEDELLVSTGLVESVVRYCCLCMVMFYHLIMFATQENIKQRYARKFCVKLNKSATETFTSLTEAYGDATLWRTMVFKWHKALKEGRENAEDDPRSGRPISSTNDQNVEVVRAVMAKDCRMSVKMIAAQTVNHACYKDVLERHRKWVQRVHTDIADDWVLHHDNAPAHTVLSIREFLAKENIPVLPHRPYSPNLAPCNFYLFYKLKFKLKSHHFGTMENIQKVIADELHTLTENDFQYCYDQWKKLWNHCVTPQGSYFEGDNL